MQDVLSGELDLERFGAEFPARFIVAPASSRLARTSGGRGVRRVFEAGGVVVLEIAPGGSRPGVGEREPGEREPGPPGGASADR